MSRIDLQIVGTANFAQIEAALTRVKAQLASINAMKMIGPIGPGVQSQLDGYLKTFRDTIDATGMYERHVVNMTNETEKFGRSLERGNLRLGQLYRTALEYRRSEMGQIRQLAREQVRMQNAVAVARNGTTADVFVPRGLDEGIEKTRILSKEYQILRQVISNGSTELINWGKNTQWAGRQLTVGLTVPITMFGAAAAKAFMDADQQLTRLAKVYGDATKGIVSTAELSSIRQEAVALSQEIAAGLGVSVTETLGIAADIAATGKEGVELLDATREAMRLSVLGEVDRQEAMRATLAIQTVFKQNTEGLTDSINFLNAVENQTSATINDLVTGIVKAGPVVQGLGGSIQDLSLMLVAMREGGVPASEAANAIKSSLGALINPTKQTTQVLGEFGIDLKNIVDTNAGDVIGTLMDLQSALEGLDDLSRQRSIEQIFGKFQFARINALLSNLNKAGSQTEQVMKIAAMGTSQLAQTADKELAAVTESITGRFQRAFEALKANLIPIGETFAQVGTLLLNVGNKILEVFNSLPGPIQTFFKLLTIGTAVIGPIIMITGVLGNFFGYLIKGISTLMLFKKAGREAFSMLGPESVAVKDATEQLTESLFDQTTAIETMESAIDRLVLKLEELQRSMRETANTDVVADQTALATAEASIAARGSAMYLSPENPFMRRVSGGGLNKPGSTYSHLTPEAVIKGMLGDKASSVMGMGSFIYGDRGAEVNRILGAFRSDVTSISESTVTDEQRRAMLLSAGRSQGLAGDQLEKLQQLLSEMSSAELAQMLPSWEKISAQQSQYIGTLRSIQAGLQTNFDVTTAALEQYKKDVISNGPEIAAQNLIKALNGIGVSTQEYVDQTALELESIMQEVQALPEADRPDALSRIVTEKITQGMELPAIEAIKQSGVQGFTEARKGFTETMMYAAQQTTDKMFNAGLVSEQLANAMREQITAHSNYAKSAVSLENAEKKLKATSEELANKRKEIESKVGSSNYNFQKGPDGWTYGAGSGRAEGTKVEDPELRKLLDEQQRLINKALTASKELDAARENLTQAEISLAHAEEKLEKETIAEAKRMSRDASSKEVEQAEQELANAIEKEAAERKKRAALTAQRDKAQADMNAALLRGGGTSSPEYKAALEMHQKAQAELLKSDIDLAQSQQELVNATEKLTLAKKKDAAATEKDAVETLQSANSENIQEQANIKNANATNIDTAETNANSGGGNLLTKPGGKLSLAGGMIGSALSMATMLIPTGENQALDTATNILGGAGMGASMGGMAGPWGALAGALIGAAIPAVGAFVSASDETTKRLTQYSEALGGSSVILDRFAQEMGKLKPSEQLTAAIGNIAAPEKVISEGGALLETEAGKQLLDLSKQFSGTQLVDALRAQLQQLTLLEIFTPDQAKSVAQALAIELGQPMLGQALVDGINSVLDSEGKLMQDRVAELFAGTIPELNLESMPDIQTAVGSRGGYVANLDELRQWATNNVGGIVSTLDKLREAQALITKEFMDGKITYQEYSDQMSKVREQNSLAADALYRLGDAGVNITDIIAKVAEAGGLTDQFKAAENAAKELMSTLTDAGGMPILGTEMLDSKFYTQIQIAAAYGDITESDVRTLLQLIQDPTQKANISAIFSVEGAQENAVEIIKLINSGMDTEFIMQITSNADEIGVPLNDLYASLVAISTLPTEIQKNVITDISNSPQLLGTFIENYERAMSLPDSKKELKAEIFGNDQLEFFQDNWESFINLPEEERKRAVFEYMVTGNYEFTAPTIPAPTAVTELMSPNISEMMQVFSGGGGGGGSDEISKAFDKKIKQQDQIIKQIQKEREERQKLLDLERRALDFAMQQQDLENQILIAKSEGRLADAALLQSELDAVRIADREDEKERLRQEEEDRRIKRAEREKKRLEKEKQKATDSGGGGGGGMSDSESLRIERSLQFLNDQLNAALLDNTEILDQIAEKGSSAFWKSEPIKEYTRAAQELGIPLDVINRQLGAVYDELVNKGFSEQGIRQFDRMKEALVEVGISGETLNDVLPDVFGILSDPQITRGKAIELIAKAFIKAGDSAEVATQRAKDFLRASGQKVRFTAIEDFNEELDKLIGDVLTKSQGEKISKQFAEGMKNGLTNKQILDNIYSTIYEDTLRKSIKDGMSPDKAARDAEAMANSVQSTLVSRFDRFSVQINHKATYDQTELPDWLREERDARGGFMTADAMDRAIKHTMSGTVDLAMPVGETSSNPLYVHVVNQTNSGNGGSGGGLSVGSRRYNPTTQQWETWTGNRWIPDNARAMGGLIRSFANGSIGSVRGPGGPTDDLIPAMLSNGEYVIRASSVDKYGIPFMDMINNGTFQLMASGGYSKYPSMVARMGVGGYAIKSYAAGGAVTGNNVEYNINVNVEGSNSSADEIANKVMQVMQRQEKMRGTNTRI